MNTQTATLSIIMSLLMSTLTFAQSNMSTTDYDFLLSISEPARYDLYESSFDKKQNGEVLISASHAASIDLSHPLPAIAKKKKAVDDLDIKEALQLATAFRLRGDYSQAARHYAQVVTLSDKPIHVFFYAQSLKEIGKEFLAELYHKKYRMKQGGPLDLEQIPLEQRQGLPVKLYGKIVNSYQKTPIQDVEVRLVSLCTEEEFLTTTDKNGEYIFQEHPSDCGYAMRFSKQFFEAKTIKQKAPRINKRMDVKLDSDASLTAR